jgi:TolB-like protein
MPTHAGAAIYHFDRFVLDLGRGMLSVAGAERALRPKSFALLRHFVENAGRLIDRDEIMQAVWPGVFVTDDSIAQCVSDLRRVLDDHQQQLLRTMPRRGYLFAVQPERVGAGVDAAVPQLEPAIANEPSIAVLPFQNMSGDPEQEYFADGMVEEIITALSRIRWLLVIARNSSFTYKGRAIEVRQVGRELGVRYVLEGSIRKAADRVRITAQLIEAETGAHLWADHFDGSLEDVFDLQDKVATSVTGLIEPALQAAETARSARRPTHDLTAYDLYLRAYAMTLASAARIPEALGLVEQAIKRDPGYGPALAWAAVCCVRLLHEDRSEDREKDRAKGVDFARRALEAAGEDPATLANAAYALAYFGEDIGAMIALVDRALALNPSFARGWHLSGVLRQWAGQLDSAIEHVEKSLRLSPRARVGPQLLTIGAAYFVNRRFEEAAPKLLLAIQEDPSYPPPYRYLAACYAHMGRLDDARQIVEQLRAITPVVIHAADHLRGPEHRELFLSGLRLAAGEPA